MLNARLFLTSLAAATATGAAGQRAIADPLGGLTIGGELLRSLTAEELQDLATLNELDAVSAAEAMRNDASLHVTASGRFVYLCAAAPDPVDEDGDSAFASRGGGIPTSEAFFLNSRPGAEKTIYLDFDGHQSVNNSWGHNINFPPFNTSGSSASFTEGELQQIIDTWLLVVEDFAPFDVNVTTQDPGVNALRRSNGGDSQFGVRCVMTQATSGFGNGIGGVAFLNSFNDSIDNPVFAFNKGVVNGAMTASHEVGHALGLFHDGLNSSEYHPGSSGFGETTWGPIMGAPFGKSLVQWSDGDYAGATTTQNDVGIITNGSNDIEYIAPDHPLDFSVGTILSSGVPIPGVITTQADRDGFRFTVPCDGEVSILGTTTVPGGPNLDMTIDVYNSGFLIEQVIEDQLSISASATLNLTAGQYYLTVDGEFRAGLGRGPESSYGSIGQYSLTVTSLGTCCPADVNGNGIADPGDFTAWVVAYNSGSSSCDQNGDGNCAPDDFTAWVVNYNAGC